MEIMRWAYLAVCAALTAWLLVLVARNIARVARRIREFKEEQAQQQGPPPDPFQALAELYAEQERLDHEARARRKRG